MISFSVIPLFLYNLTLFKRSSWKWVPFALCLIVGLFGFHNTRLLSLEYRYILIIPILLEVFWKVLHNRLNGFAPFEAFMILFCFSLERGGLINIFDVVLLFWICKTCATHDLKRLHSYILLLIPFLYASSKILTEIYGIHLNGLAQLQLQTANLTMITGHQLVFITSIIVFWLFILSSFNSFLKMDEFKNYWNVAIGSVLLRSLVDHYAVFTEAFELLIIFLLGLSVITYLITRKGFLLPFVTFSLLGGAHLIIFLVLLPFLGSGLSSRLTGFFRFIPNKRQLLATAILIVSSLVISSVSMHYKIIYGLVLFFLIVLSVRVVEKSEVNI